VVIFQKCVEAGSLIEFLTIHGVSGNDGCHFNISGLKDLTGYDPKGNGADRMEQLVWIVSAAASIARFWDASLPYAAGKAEMRRSLNSLGPNLRRKRAEA
jgi:hypothetical protein